ncbi:MAG: glycosyltransferase family 4 protein [Candidatus Harrisonbacteria bacterium]|nr:glycosyltransferase family 4 protein [Candidatus Harrisonbacteria bacterium]
MRKIILARNMTGNGVERYITGLIEEIEKEQNADHYVLITDSKRLAYKAKKIKIFLLPFANRIFFDFGYSFFLLLFYPRAILFYTKNIIPPLHFLLPQKKMVLVHDLGYFSPVARGKAYPFFDRLYARLFLRLSLTRAKLILAVSETTKKMIERKYPAVIKKIRVAAPGIRVWLPEEEKRKDILKKYSLIKPYFLYPGSISPRKNIPRLVEAFLAASLPLHHLYLTGGRGWGEDKEKIKKYIQEKGEGRAQFLPFLSDEELYSIMAEARGVTYPSLLEGVGLPILEAQKLKVPVLTSEIPELRETAGEGAIFIDPRDTSSLQKGLEELAGNEEKRRVIIKKGEENSRRYSYAKTTRAIF